MEQNKDSIITSPIEDVLHSSMMPYAEYVILDRALPRVEDGLKPVQRRILYSMYDLGITPDKGYKKSARVVGDCLAKYHPHGDTSVYDAMVRLAQPYNMRNTLVDGHGNFGSIDGDSAAAMRYTEVKLQPLALELVTDLDKDTVNWQLNFDDSIKEPETLPGRFPNLLVNGATGIAVGLATNIPTHNLGEVIDGTVAYLDNPDITLDEMMKIIKGPDFPTGGYIIAGSELRTAYETGKGKIQIRAKVNIENAENGKKNIVITEIPFQVNKAQLLSKMASLQEENKDILGGIADIADESDRFGMRAVIKLKKDVNPKPILDFFYKNTQLQTSYGINMVAIADGKPKLMGLLEIYKYYVDYQISVILRRTKFDLVKCRDRAHILEGLIIAVNDIDAVIKIIKESPDTPTAKKNLREKFDLSDKQAQAILDLRLARITQLEVNNLKDELAQLKKQIEELQSIVDSKKKQREVVKKEILVIKKKYKDARKSVIVNTVEDIAVAAIKHENFVDNFVLGVNGNNLIRKVKVATYKKYANNQTPAKGEIFKFKIEINSDQTLYAFTNKGNCHKIDLEFIPEASGGQSGGVKFAQIVKSAETGEKPIAFFAVNGDDVPSGKLIFITAGGIVKVSSWSEYAVSKTSFQAIKLKEKDEVITVEEQRQDSELFFVTNGGLCLDCVGEFPEYGRVSGGVKGIDLADGDKVIYATQIDSNKEYEVVIATSFGTFKKVILGMINKMPRASKGKKVVDLGRDGKESVLLAEPVIDGEEILIAIEDENGNMYHVSSLDIMPESLFTKGKILPCTGIIKSNWVCSFRPKNRK